MNKVRCNPSIANQVTHSLGLGHVHIEYRCYVHTYLCDVRTMLRPSWVIPVSTSQR